MDADIPPFVVNKLPAGSVIPPFALITPLAFIIVVFIPPFAIKKLPADTVIPLFAFINCVAFNDDV